MTNREIQEQRIKEFFVGAAMKIVREEGEAAVTVRRIANEAGYAPGTLYNYFRDLNELLFNCVVEFFQECRDYALEFSREASDPVARLLSIAEAYSSYFLRNPNIYHLVFLADISVPENATVAGHYQPEIVRISAELLQQCAQEGRVDPADTEVILSFLANTIHGNLLFFLTGRSGNTTETSVLEKIRYEMRWVIERSARSPVERNREKEDKT